MPSAETCSLTTGSAAEPSRLTADAVVLAVPGPPAARLLADVVPAAAAEVAALEYASVALVTLVLAGPTPGTGSGYLVPAVEGRTTKAVTFTSRKWTHFAGGPAVVRASVGRHGETRDLQRSDAELVAAVLGELRQAVGPLPVIVGSRVVRWGGGLPQYAVGHLDRVRRVRAGVARQPGLAVAGAAYDGVGVPGRERGVERLDHPCGRDAGLECLGGRGAVEDRARVVGIDTVGDVHDDLAVERRAQLVDDWGGRVDRDREDHHLGGADSLGVG